MSHSASTMSVSLSLPRSLAPSMSRRVERGDVSRQYPAQDRDLVLGEARRDGVAEIADRPAGVLNLDRRFGVGRRLCGVFRHVLRGGFRRFHASVLSERLPRRFAQAWCAGCAVGRGWRSRVMSPADS